MMESEKPGSSFSFRFKGNMFRIFDVGGPEVGQLSIKVDGKEMKLQEVSGRGYRLYKASTTTGNDVLNLFNAFCNNRYRGQYDFIETEDGEHTVTITLSDKKSDKAENTGRKTIAGYHGEP